MAPSAGGVHERQPRACEEAVLPSRVLVAIVVDVKRRVAATASLASVSRSRKRLPPPHLPLWLLPVLGSHLA
jgi:hypothetical protein